MEDIPIFESTWNKRTCLQLRPKCQTDLIVGKLLNFVSPAVHT